MVQFGSRDDKHRSYSQKVRAAMTCTTGPWISSGMGWRRLPSLHSFGRWGLGIMMSLGHNAPRHSPPVLRGDASVANRTRMYRTIWTSRGVVGGLSRKLQMIIIPLERQRSTSYQRAYNEKERYEVSPQSVRRVVFLPRENTNHIRAIRTCIARSWESRSMKLERSLAKKITIHQNCIRNQAYIRGYYASCLLHTDC
jgi:hypothetical protein